MTNFDYYYRGVANCLALLLWINISYPAGRPFGCGRCKSERTLISQLGASLSCLSIWIGFECGRKSHDESPVIEYDECSGGSKGSRSSSQWSLSESEVNRQLCGANGLSLERSDDSQRKSTSLISAYQFRRGALLGVASRPTPYVCLINVDCKQRSTSKVSSTRRGQERWRQSAICTWPTTLGSWEVGGGGGVGQPSIRIFHSLPGHQTSWLLAVLCCTNIYSQTQFTMLKQNTYDYWRYIYEHHISTHTHIHNNNIIFCLG